MKNTGCTQGQTGILSFIRLSQSQRLFGAVLLFILLDLGVLLINYQIAYQVSRDAAAINLAGRQRMLSQRITKTLLELEHPETPQTDKQQEFREAVLSFDQTLHAFQHGGVVIGGDGKPTHLQQIAGRSSQLVQQAQDIWQPMCDAILPYASNTQPIPPEKLDQARSLMLQNNLQILTLMNSLTSNLEQDSRGRADTLRTIQTLVFILALLNFISIVRGFHLLTRQAVENSQRFDELARRDPLTGLFNRRQFTEALEREASATQRRQGGFALLMIDLDNFKPINDLHGHAAGDTVLLAVSTRLSGHARVHDTVARIGGDEFVLICPDLSTEQAAADLCERLLRSLNQPIELTTGTVSIGASIGIAFYPADSESVDTLICKADKAMYQAKQTGRNNWIFSTPGNEDTNT